MGNLWFRMYHDFATNPKVQVNTEALQRRYVMLLCLHCNGNLENAPDDEIALSLRVTVDEWLETKSTLIKRGLINENNLPTGWEKKQYISDIKDPTASERQKRYRAKKRDNRNATVTSRLPEADTDTEQIKKKSIKKKKPKISLDELSVDHVADWLNKKRALGKYLCHDEHFILEQFKQYCTANGKKYDNYISAYQNAFEWDRLQPKATTGNKTERLYDAARRAAEQGGYAFGVEHGETEISSDANAMLPKP